MSCFRTKKHTFGHMSLKNSVNVTGFGEPESTTGRMKIDDCIY